MRYIRQIFSGVLSLSRILYSAGQTFFSIRKIDDYFFKNNSHKVLPYHAAIAITANAAVNLITRVPAIHKKFASENEPVEPLDPHPRYNVLGTTLNIIFQCSALIAGVFTGLNAYLGGVTLTNEIAGDRFDSHENNSYEIMSQSVSIFLAVTAMITYFTYEFFNTRYFAQKISKDISEGNIPPANRYLNNVAFIAGFNIFAAVILAYFWNKPSLEAIPHFKEDPYNSSIDPLIILSCVTSFFATLATTPSIYSYFQKEKPQYPITPLSRAIRYTGYLGGFIDSSTAGLTSLIGLIEFFNALFKTSNDDTWVFILATLCGLSSAVCNQAFSIEVGYYNFLDFLYPQGRVDLSRQPPSPAEGREEATLLNKRQDAHSRFSGLLFSTVNPVLKGKSPERAPSPLQGAI